MALHVLLYLSLHVREYTDTRSKIARWRCSGCCGPRSAAGPSIPGLIIAATAELAGLTVLHLDKDFEIIADVAGQPLERLNIGTGAPAGS